MPDETTTADVLFGRNRFCFFVCCWVCLASVLAGQTVGTCGVAVADEPLSSPPEQPQRPDPSRWEKDIRKLTANDKTDPPPLGGVVFVGSSSIRKWDLAKFFPKQKTINRGFGGSNLADSLHYADRIVLPYRPATVILYAGDNDINKGLTPNQVRDDFRAFVRRIHATLPETRIGFVAIKPSLKRWPLVEKMRAANTAIQEICRHDEKLFYVDIDTPMLGSDGKPRPELFVKDGLHLSDAGYELWSNLLRAQLK